MSSTGNPTPKLQLNQWQSSDKPERLDFNGDNQKIDQAFINLETQLANKVHNQNLLDNWYFGPGVINQRGETVYSGTGYTIDRWWSIFNTLTLEPNGINIMCTSDQYSSALRQAIEYPSRLAGKKMTLSVLVSELNVGSGNGFRTAVLKSSGMNTGMENICISNWITEPGLHTVTFTVPNDIGSGTYPMLLVSLHVGIGSSAKIFAAKLELGDTQTLAHQETSGNWVLHDLAPNPQQELAKCQRYQLVLDANGGVYSSSVGSEAKTVIVFIPTPVSMRISPMVVTEDLKLVCSFFAPTGAYSQKVCTVSGTLTFQNGIKMTLEPDAPLGSTAYIGVNTIISSKVILDSNL